MAMLFTVGTDADGLPDHFVPVIAATLEGAPIPEPATVLTAGALILAMLIHHRAGKRR
jgi:hypothetical protein